MQFNALYNSYTINSIDELAIFNGFRDILDYMWKKLKNIVIFYKNSQIFFLLWNLENYIYMQFKALFKSFKMSIWNIYTAILVIATRLFDSMDGSLFLPQFTLTLPL